MLRGTCCVPHWFCQMQMFRYVLWLGLVAGLCACVPKEVRLPGEYVRPAGRDIGAALPEAEACRIAAVVEDGRSEDDIASGFGLSMLKSADPAAWLRSGIFSLSSDRYRLVPPAGDTASNPPDLRMVVKLRKMYMLSLTTSKSATVVISVELADAQSRPFGNTMARGTDTSVNWAYGEGEIGSAFNGSLAQVLQRLDVYLNGQCRRFRQV